MQQRPRNQSRLLTSDTLLPRIIPPDSLRSIRMLLRNTLTRRTPRFTMPLNVGRPEGRRRQRAQHAGERANTAKQYNEQLAAIRQQAKEQDAIARCNHVLTAGDGDLVMGFKRVTGLPTGASASNSDAASITHVTSMVTDRTIWLNRMPT